MRGECYWEPGPRHGQEAVADGAPVETPARRRQLAAEAVLAACHDAFVEGYEAGVRQCALRRLGASPTPLPSEQDSSDEGTAAYLLLVAVNHAKGKGVDLPALAERLISEGRA